jgi:pimeloyl-ACP methyl ester carboxylesterase
MPTFAVPDRYGTVMKIRDVDLVVRDTGGTGISVLLIHGSLAKDFLLPLGEALTTTGKFRVISYDRRGYGCRPARAQDMEREAEDASEVLRQLGIGNAHVFGHSTGGSIALQLAHQSPDQVASLLLGEPDIPWRHAPSRAAIEEGYKQLAEMYEKEPKEDVLGAIMSELHGPNYMDVFPADMRDLAAADMSVFFEFEYQAFLDWQLAPGGCESIQDAGAVHLRREHWADKQRSGRGPPTVERRHHHGPDSRIDSHVPLDPSAGGGRGDRRLRTGPRPIGPQRDRRAFVPKRVCSRSEGRQRRARNGVPAGLAAEIRTKTPPTVSK